MICVEADGHVQLPTPQYRGAGVLVGDRFQIGRSSTCSMHTCSRPGKTYKPKDAGVFGVSQQEQGVRLAGMYKRIDC